MKKPLLSPKQAWSIKNATKRLNIWEGSVRSGKTVGKIYAFLRYCAYGPPGDYLLAGKTIDALKRNVIGPLLELTGSEASYHPGLREMKIFGRKIHVVGASDERSEGKIRGATFAGGAGDELTLWPESFFQMLLSRMSVEGAQFFGSTNPDNPNHWLKKNFLDRHKELDLARFHFSIDDNPFLPQSYVESLKKEYIGLWYKRFILGEWCVAEGAVFDFFDEKSHCINNLPTASYYDVGVDYGTNNPCVFILYGNNAIAKRGELKIWAEREYYYDPHRNHRGKTDAEFAKDFIAFISPVKDKVRNIYCDPSAESFQLQLKQDLQKAKMPIPLKDAENDRLNGVRTVARMLKSGEFAIYKPGCPEYVQEMYSYSWDKKKQEKGVDEPLKVNDHCQDNGRYVLHTKYGVTGQYDIRQFVN